MAKIVLADDDKFIRVAYKDGLTRAGHIIDVAEDGEEAIEVVKKVKPDLVLLDLIMPKLNGFEVLEKLKSDPEVKDIPVVILTNLSKDTDENDAKSKGAVTVLVKSDISLSDLVDYIQQLLVKY